VKNKIRVNRLPVPLPLIYSFIFIFCSIHFLINSKPNVNTNRAYKTNIREKILRLKKVMDITDDKGNFYFQYPQDLKTGSDGSIYVREFSQMLRFDQNGKLLNNYYRKGQGPGELVSMRSYFIKEDYLIIYNGTPKKIVWFHKNGKQLKEFRLYQKFFSGKLILYDKGVYYFITKGIPIINGNVWKVVDVNYNLVKISGSENMSKIMTIPVKESIINYGSSRGSVPAAKFVYRISNDGRYLIYSNTEEYSIKIYDIKKNRLIREFRREYKRFKNITKKDSSTMILQGKNFKLPKRKYDNDVKDIFFQYDKILVLTSTVKNNSVLIDRFDWDGNYLDFFYLKINGDILLIKNNFVYVREKNEEENPFIVKYILDLG